jgi:hypothetical protein
MMARTGSSAPGGPGALESFSMRSWVRSGVWADAGIAASRKASARVGLMGERITGGGRKTVAFGETHIRESRYKVSEI